MAYDAWGFHHAADKPGREGHAVAMMGQAEAAGAINALHAKFEDRQTLLASAVNVDQRVRGCLFGLAGGRGAAP
jgi:hypothetical protein